MFYLKSLWMERSSECWGATALPASKKSHSAVSFRGFYGQTFNEAQQRDLMYLKAAGNAGRPVALNQHQLTEAKVSLKSEFITSAPVRSLETRNALWDTLSTLKRVDLALDCFSARNATSCLRDSLFFAGTAAW